MMHPIWLTFADSEREAAYMSHWSPSNLQFMRTAMAVASASWFIACPMAATSQSLVRYLSLGIAALLLLLISFLQCIRQGNASRVREFFTFSIIGIMLQLCLAWPSIFDGEIEIAQRIIEVQGDMDSPVAHRLIAATAIGEIRGMVVIFLLITNTVLCTPLSLAGHCLLIFFGSAAFSITSALIVRPLKFGDSTDWMQNHHRFAIFIYICASGVFTYRSWLNEMGKRKSFLLKIQDEHSQNMLIVEKEEKARVEANMNSWVCHEIRNPFNGVVGFNELILESAKQDNLNERREQIVRMSLNIQQSSQFITSLLDNMLDLAKIDAGKMKLRSDKVDLFDVIADLRRLSIPMTAAGVELKTTFFKDGVQCAGTDENGVDSSADCHDFIIMADAQRWRQVLLNLVSNALRFTKIGFVHISVEIFAETELNGKKDVLRVSVADTGTGISASDAARLFQKYEQVHNAGSGGGGTGLGLVLAQKIAALWGSRIEIESPWEQKSCGSMFHFTIEWAPAARSWMNMLGSEGVDLQEVVVDPLDAAVLEAKLTGATVLIVEDEALNTLLMTTKLTKSSELAKYNFKVSPLASADEAMNLLHMDPDAFDIIIMDEHFEEVPDELKYYPHVRPGAPEVLVANADIDEHTPTPAAATDQESAEDASAAQERIGTPANYVLGSSPGGPLEGGVNIGRPLRGSEAIRLLRDLGCSSAIISCSGNCLVDDTAAYKNAGATISWPKPYPTAVDMKRDLLQLYGHKNTARKSL
jgi:signal transduction histidine kinase